MFYSIPKYYFTITMCSTILPIKKSLAQFSKERPWLFDILNKKQIIIHKQCRQLVKKEKKNNADNVLFQNFHYS